MCMCFVMLFLFFFFLILSNLPVCGHSRHLLVDFFRDIFHLPTFLFPIFFSILSFSKRPNYIANPNNPNPYHFDINTQLLE